MYIQFIELFFSYAVFFSWFFFSWPLHTCTTFSLLLKYTRIGIQVKSLVTLLKKKEKKIVFKFCMSSNIPYDVVITSFLLLIKDGLFFNTHNPLVQHDTIATGASSEQTRQVNILWNFSKNVNILEFDDYICNQHEKCLQSNKYK